jgi:hypothetical protein
VQRVASIIGLSLLLSVSGCTATCLRDSDCIGASVCLQDRCVLLITPLDSAASGRDAGGTAAVVSRTPTPAPTSSPTSTRAIGDAGSGDVGSAATATRGFFDAASDAASSAPRP